jgi:hypothetical protein
MEGRENDYISAGALGGLYGKLEGLALIQLCSWGEMVQLGITAGDKVERFHRVPFGRG